MTNDLPAAGSRCAQCGAPLECGFDDPAGCWCARLPPLAKPLPGGACLCPVCLQCALAKAREAAGGATASANKQG